MAKCCVSFSAYYVESGVLCNTYACGYEDEDTRKCDKDVRALLLPAETLLVPFANRMIKVKAFAKVKHMDLPRKLSCPDNCPLKKAFVRYENVYSFNGTKLPKVNRTIFMQGFPGFNYLIELTNGSKPGKPLAPGKQQYVISFLKKNTP
ncbi:hypothetical protein L2E82_18888 [Cichorium intybus]|uniref:Uncharacterized protein n=1 Tax=Cichorium intybus TaxID=13427 RepID=A0ACB9FAK8_CICIN|nr:hypothetical protein L2E82_18888 [Cichorium intybus]